VWGSHATPIDSCFVDLLDSEETFLCYNAGVPGTDPAQYAAIADLYVPLLRPDFTVVAVYLANDLMSEPRMLLPNEELWYQTTQDGCPLPSRESALLLHRNLTTTSTNRYATDTYWEKLLLKSLWALQYFIAIQIRGIC